MRARWGWEQQLAISKRHSHQLRFASRHQVLNPQVREFVIELDEWQAAFGATLTFGADNGCVVAGDLPF